MNPIAQRDPPTATTEVPVHTEAAALPDPTPAGPAEPSKKGAVSSLGVARARRKLQVGEIAEQAGLTVEAVDALEQSRLYRFPTQRDAIAAAVLYGSALGISVSEARELAGLPPRDSLLGRSTRIRAAAIVAFAIATVLLAWFVIVPRLADEPPVVDADVATLLPAPELVASLPERWEIEVDILNGSEVGRAGARLADKIAGLSYQIKDVGNAPRNDYPETRVYYTPGSAGIAERLAAELGVTTQELPGGNEPRRLVVVAGAEAPLD
jgi:hypothetical protein